MKDLDQKTVTPTIVLAAGGSPKTAPNCSPPKNQSKIAARLQRAAEVKNNFGLGKNDTNTVAISSVDAQISGAAVGRA
jgi:hypothetical protein